MIQAADTSLPVGSLFEQRYEILGELGSGSFGRVFKARQLSTGQLVAVKVMRWAIEADESDSRSRIQRFRRETLVCAELWHPNIVRLIDSGETPDGRLYAAFEFVPGATLKDVLTAEGKLGVAESVHLMTQVLDALSCAHALGIVHRDLKPENIMITKTGARRNALVLDFGLGGFAAETTARSMTRITATREMLGTPCYAAPEQLRGEPTTTRSDLYSWGLIFLECLTGEMPMRGASTQEVILNQLGPDPVAIPQWLRNHPLGRVLEFVTAKRAEKRDISIERLLETFGAMGTAAEPSAPLPDPALTERERRQLTVVCCRMTVAPEGGRQADIEEVDQLSRVELSALGTRAARAGAVVAAVAGDRAFLVFGYPQVHEDDARRAARFALEIVHQKHAARGPFCVDVGVGIHTGLVIVRDPRQRTDRRLDELTGLTPEIAGRLADIADPGHVLVSPDTYRLLRGEFEAEPGGVCAIGELSHPLSVLRLLSARKVPETESSSGSRLTPLIGRAPQLQQLLDGWAKARAGRNGALVIIGEAGIGKSRLLQELRAQTGDEGAWLKFECAPENQTTPLRPVIDALLAMDASIESLLTRFGFDLGENLPLFSALLSIPLDDRYSPRPLSPELQKELTLQALVSLVSRIAEERPTVLVLENLHWADPTTLELASLLIQELRVGSHAEPESGPKLYAIFTTRPEFTPLWSGENVALLPLQRLLPAEVEEMVKAGLGEVSALPTALVQRVVQRAEGVPLFVEEITRVVVEARGSEESGPLSSQSTVQIPASLRDLLTARLDRVSAAARDTAQLAAVLGREFHYDMLVAVSRKDSAFVHQDVTELARAGLVFRGRSGRSETCVFRHALLRDAAYEAMTRSTREALHQRVAGILREKFPEIERSRPEVLALHREQGGELGEAVDYWQRAAEASYRRAAYAEALSQTEHALALVRSLEPSAENRRREVGLLVVHGTTLLSTRGWAVPEVEATFSQALALCEQLGGQTPQMVLYGIWAVRITRSDREGIDALLPRLRELATRVGDRVYAEFGCSCLGTAAFWRGDFPTAHHYLEQALQYYDEESHRASYDGGLYTYAFEFCTLWTLGYADRAKALLAEALAIAERRRDPYSLSLVLGFGGDIAYDTGDFRWARQWAERMTALAEEQRLFAWWAPAAVQYGRVLVSEGRADEGIELIRQGLERYRLLGVMCAYNYHLRDLAVAYLESHRFADAAATIEEGLVLCRTLVARFHEPELLRLRGRLLLEQGDATGAEESFRGALAMAERDGARAFALKAATDLSRLLSDSGTRDEAVAALAPIYAQFTEGFDTKDLLDASALLRALSNRD
jgi:TOMM system kinase/cyclase fusion protein